MNNDRELMQAVLEAMESLHRTGDTQVFDMYAAPVLIPALRERMAQPEQEPVAWTGVDFAIDCTPPRREWVGLTDDDLKPVCDEYRILFGGWVHDFARAIEAKLREKNGT